MKGWSLADLVVVISKRLGCTDQECLQPNFAIDEGQGHQIVAIQEQQIEQEKDQRTPAGIAGVLDQIESRPSIGEHTAEFAIKIGVLRRQFGYCRGDCGLFVRPIVAAAGQDLHTARIEPGVHPIAIQLDLVQPIGASRGRCDKRR